MGDRANFGFVQPNGNTIVLYGHWAGHNMLAQLAEAAIKASAGEIKLSLSISAKLYNQLENKLISSLLPSHA